MQGPWRADVGGHEGCGRLNFSFFATQQMARVRLSAHPWNLYRPALGRLPSEGHS